MMRIGTILLYALVFSGCYLYFIRELPHRGHRWLGAAVLFAALLAFHTQSSSATLSMLVVRYSGFALLYSIWSLIFLKVRPGYAIYLSLFFTIFMGAWVSCTQILLIPLMLNQAAFTLVTGILRVLSIVILKCFFIQVDETRSLSPLEMVINLLPAVSCFLANLVIFDLLGQSDAAGSFRGMRLLGPFFSICAMVVLVSSETWFRMNHYQEEMRRAQEQLDAQYRLFLLEKQNDEKLRAFRHDLKNHLDTIEAMSHTGDVKRYIENLRNAEQQTRKPISTGCSTLDALLLVKQPMLEEKQIRLKCLMHWPETDILSPMELCSLFSNSLDNAAEAIEAGEFAPEQREIRLSGAEINGHLVYRIENPCRHVPKVQMGRLLTTKPDAEHHGYGIANMQRIVEAHGGTLTCKAENGVFRLIFSIPCLQDQEQNIPYRK